MIDAEVRKRGEQTGLDTPSPRGKRCALGVGADASVPELTC